MCHTHRKVRRIKWHICDALEESREDERGNMLIVSVSWHWWRWRGWYSMDICSYLFERSGGQKLILIMMQIGFIDFFSFLLRGTQEKGIFCGVEIKSDWLTERKKLILCNVCKNYSVDSFWCRRLFSFFGYVFYLHIIFGCVTITWFYIFYAYVHTTFYSA